MSRKRKLTLLFFSLIFILSLFNIIKILYEYYSSNKSYIDLQDNVIQNNSAIIDSSNEDTWHEYIDIDFDKLKNINSDIIGWIYFENETINYPILFSGDNETYLNKLYTGEVSKSASIFLDGNNTTDFTDSHMLIYGHNMRDLTMFGKLKYYNQQEDYYENNKYFQIHTNDVIQRYEIFAFSIVDETYNIETIKTKDNQLFSYLITNIQNNSNTLSDINISQYDKIITLCTCSSENIRLLVHAIKIAEYKK